MLTLNFHPFPILSTARLILREIRNDDAKELFSLRSDNEVMQYISRPLAKSMEDASKLIKIIDDILNNNEGITWAITLKNDPALSGQLATGK